MRQSICQIRCCASLYCNQAPSGSRIQIQVVQQMRNTCNNKIHYKRKKNYSLIEMYNLKYVLYYMYMYSIHYTYIYSIHDDTHTVNTCSLQSWWVIRNIPFCISLNDWCIKFAVILFICVSSLDRSHWNLHSLFRAQNVVLSLCLTCSDSNFKSLS